MGCSKSKSNSVSNDAIFKKTLTMSSSAGNLNVDNEWAV